MLPLSPKVALVANGEITSYSQTKKLLLNFEKIIAVDGGLNHCEKMGIVPFMIIGDLDSAKDSILKKHSQALLFQYPKEKDESDLELAIQKLLKQGIDSLALFGVLGQRVDHLLYTLYLLTRYPSQLIIESESEIIFCLPKQSQVAAFPGQTISLIPLNEVTAVTTEGLQWEVDQAVFDKKFMSLSNVCLDHSFKVSLQSGDLLCCLQKKT